MKIKWLLCILSTMAAVAGAGVICFPYLESAAMTRGQLTGILIVVGSCFSFAFGLFGGLDE